MSGFVIDMDRAGRRDEAVQQTHLPLRDANQKMITADLDDHHAFLAADRDAAGDLQQIAARGAQTLQLSGEPGEREDQRDHQREADRKSTRLNSSHYCATRMPSSA